VTARLAGRRLAYLGCAGTLSHSPIRRADAFEHDLELAALRAGFQAVGADIEEADWQARTDWSRFDLVLVRTCWDYHDHAQAFLAFAEACPVPLANSVAALAWNIDKRYLLDLQAQGLPVVPTAPGDGPLCPLFDQWHCQELVLKPRIGASGEGQRRIDRAAGATVAPDPSLLAQPFLTSIRQHGEVSLIYLCTGFSHAVLKRPAATDYRIQSLYGGREERFDAPADMIALGERFVAAVPPPWLAVRVDLVQGPAGWCLMELEAIEPYLYPAFEPAFGRRFAEAAADYLQAMAANPLL